MDLRRVDLNLLRLLDAVLIEGSASRAAKRLRLSQPAVSQGLIRARDVFGDPLMVRHGNRLMPTARGIALRPELSALLRQIEALIAPDAFDPATASRDFVLASSDLGQVLVLPALIAAITQRAPGCRIKVIPPPDEDGELTADLLIMGAPAPKGPLRWKPLFDDRFVLLARKGHPVLECDLTKAAFVALPQALVSPRAAGFEGAVDQALARLGLQRKVVLMLTNFMALPDVLVASDLVAAVPMRFGNLPWVAAQCGYRDLPIEVPGYQMKAVWPLTGDSDASQVWLRSLLPTIAGPATP